MPPKKNLTRNINDGGRVITKDYRHHFAIELIKQSLSNIELEIAQKKRAIKVILLDRALDQAPVRFMGIKIRRMQVEKARLERSMKLLEKNNKQDRENIDQIARSNQPLI